VELFYVSDEVWRLAGFGPTDIACLTCMEKGLGRKLGLHDLAPFPWGDVNRPVYFRGIIDGARGTPDDTMGEYQAGASLGKRLAEHSTPNEIQAFRAANP
jgi:hypothetical protein